MISGDTGSRVLAPERRLSATSIRDKADLASIRNGVDFTVTVKPLKRFQVAL
jgi:hypothetical protein